MNFVRKLLGRKERRKEQERERSVDMELFQLYTVLTNHDDWWNAQNCNPLEQKRKNMEAKVALQSYYGQLVKVGPVDNRPEKEKTERYGRRMRDIEAAFHEEKYMRACNEIISLMYYQPFLREDIYTDLCSVLERNLGVP
ncbi:MULTISPECIES: hypothetical protein [Bacillaceae]|uniref:hypothetical protein n=1 Tax=Bacillaceae TaxID=186817 RepID=UPI0006935208|nr:hypothetical protein [Bacillus rubiinfantis]